MAGVDTRTTVEGDDAELVPLCRKRVLMEWPYPGTSTSLPGQKKSQKNTNDKSQENQQKQIASPASTKTMQLIAIIELVEFELEKCILSRAAPLLEHSCSSNSAILNSHERHDSLNFPPMPREQPDPLWLFIDRFS